MQESFHTPLCPTGDGARSPQACTNSTSSALVGLAGGSASPCLRALLEQLERPRGVRADLLDAPIIFLGGKSSGICSNMPSHAASIVRAAWVPARVQPATDAGESRDNR